jgi:hypothetical protein
MTYIITCKNRPVLTDKCITDNKVIIHDDIDMKGVGHHRNQVIEDALNKNITKFWLLDDDIQYIYTAGEKTSYGYKKIKSVLDLSKVIFPEDTALGSLSTHYFPLTNKEGFSESSSHITQFIYLNMDLIGHDYRYPEDYWASEDSDLLIRVFAKNLSVKRYLGAQFHANDKISMFDINHRIQSTLYALGLCKQFETNPRVKRLQKFFLEKSIKYYGNNKEALQYFESEIKKRNLYPEEQTLGFKLI